ncbi:hypothetical protein DQ04_00561000 [Trypanosoma grayi]|uniref:hypothetical protein n=1 Tax=Trypanosoma grayi TaxID=71804 RepID=UPI0004F4B385|nr:hypothetical protein DQ04_00561000 [Trypanosoma grayi]KEG14231.1 hypothetical protein DQ04_00561000 [Trypanosoma grayi]
MPHNNTSRHVDAVFAQLERGTRDPAGLYRHLLQRAVAQLDAVAAERDALRGTISALQQQRCEQNRRLRELRQQLEEMQRWVNFATSCSHTPASPPPRPSPSSRAHDKKQQQQQQRGVGSAGGRRAPCRVAEAKRHACGSCSATTSTTSPPPTESSSTESTLPKQRRPPETDPAVVERVLGNVLLLAWGDDSPKRVIVEEKPHDLKGNAGALYDTVMSTVHILRTRETALRRRVRELEAELRRDEALRLAAHVAEEYRTTTTMLQGQCDGTGNEYRQALSYPPPPPPPAGRVASSTVLTCSSFSSARAVQHGGFTAPTATATAATAVASGGPTTTTISSSSSSSSVVEAAAAAEELTQYCTNSNPSQNNNADLDDLVGATELREYAEWKHSFLQELLPGELPG